MKVAVVGAEGSGKSVLAAALAEALRLPLLASPREQLLADSGYHTLFEWAAAGHSWATLVQQQAAREAAVADVVVDGGVLDQYCLFQRWGWNASSPEAAEELRERALAEARRYDRIVVTPPRLVAGYAPARFRNGAHNQQLARLLDALLRDGELTAVVRRLDDGDEAARLRQALQLVGP